MGTTWTSSPRFTAVQNNSADVALNIAAIKMRNSGCFSQELGQLSFVNGITTATVKTDIVLEMLSASGAE